MHLNKITFNYQITKTKTSLKTFSINEVNPERQFTEK